MGTTVITSVTGRNSNEETFITGTGPANTYIFVTKDGHGHKFGHGATDARGRFNISLGKLQSDIYDWVVCESSADGRADESKGYSAKVRQVVDAS